MCSQLEQYLLNRRENFPNLFPDYAENESFYLGRSYLALAAPPTEGKTQFAFTCADLKMLYFPLLTGESALFIYRNFQNHTRTLLECVEKDLQLLRNDFTSAGTLRQSHLILRLFTLGFIFQLAQKYVNCWNEEAPLKPFAELPGFTFVPRSIDEVALILL